jgi:NAD(P)H dehydrogenase (quinone)
MIAVTGAAGRLGRLTVGALLARGIPAGEVVAVVRDPAAAADLAAAGVRVRRGDYDRPHTLPAALAGVDRLLLVSSPALDGRVRQHRAVVEAAAAAGVGLLAYTSIPRADTARTRLAAEHRATERLIQAAGLPFAFLRNSWYVESYTDRVARFLASGAIVGAAGEGRVSAATRADLAAAAAAVLTGSGPGNTGYELGGDESFSLAELAAAICARSGRPVAYRDLPVAGYEAALTRIGLPPALAGMFADADAGVARGELFVPSGDLRRLLGRPPVPYRVALDAAVDAAVAVDAATADAAATAVDAAYVPARPATYGAGEYLGIARRPAGES